MAENAAQAHMVRPSRPCAHGDAPIVALVAFEPRPRLAMGGAMTALIGGLHPVVQMLVCGRLSKTNVDRDAESDGHWCVDIHVHCRGDDRDDQRIARRSIAAAQVRALSPPPNHWVDTD